MSSHREAPEISKDPVADSTDVYAFVSPDAPDTVTLIANYIPLQSPAGGPNFFEFGDDVLYEIHVDNDGDGKPDVTYQFRFKTEIRVGGTFLYNVGPDHRARQQDVESPADLLGDAYRLEGQSATGPTLLEPARCRARRATSGRCRRRTTPALANSAIRPLAGGGRVFAGQRREGFYVDLGSVFDLGNLRPFQQLHAQFGLNIPELTRPAPGVNATKAVNVHSIALQLPKSKLLASGVSGTDRDELALRDRRLDHGEPAEGARARRATARRAQSGPFAQVSRLGNPLFNEVLVPDGAQGLLERATAVRRPAVRRRASRSPSSRSSSRCSTPACSRTSPRSTRRGSRAPTCSRSCSPGSRPV